MEKMIKEFNSYRTKMNEIFMIANLVGGPIVISHYRRALEYWEGLNN